MGAPEPQITQIYSGKVYLSADYTDCFDSCWLVTVNCFAGDISSEELIQNAKEYDGGEVTFQGEVIGDIMKWGKFPQTIRIYRKFL